MFPVGRGPEGLHNDLDFSYSFPVAHYSFEGFFSHPTDHLYTGECFGDDVGDVKFVSCGFLKSPLYFKQTQAVWLFLTGHVF